MNWKKKHPGSDFLVKPHGLQSTSHETHRIGKYKQRPLGTDDESLACTNLFNPTLDCRSNVDIQADDPCEDSWGTVAHPITVPFHSIRTSRVTGLFKLSEMSQVSCVTLPLSESTGGRSC